MLDLARIHEPFFEAGQLAFCQTDVELKRGLIRPAQTIVQ